MKRDHNNQMSAAIGGAVRGDHILNVYMDRPSSEIGDWTFDYIKRFYDRYGEHPDLGVYIARFPLEVSEIRFVISARMNLDAPRPGKHPAGQSPA